MMRRWWMVFSAVVLFFLIPGAIFQTAGSGMRLSRQLPQIAPDGWALEGTVRSFSPQTLWEQINGRAEFYLSYGMIRMTYAVYTPASDPKTFVDLFIYDMGEPVNAFGAFSAERRKDANPVDLGRGGYRTGVNLFFWKGACYVRLIASETDVTAKAAVYRLAERTAGLIEDAGKPLWGLEMLPGADRVPGSERYFRKDALGLDFLQNTYTAQYRKRGVRIDCFLLREKNPTAARSVLDRYSAYADQFGGTLREISRDGEKILFFDMDGSFDALFQKGDLVAGVTAAPDGDLAVDAAFEFRRQLEGR